MHLAIWDAPPAEFIVSGFTSGAVEAPVEIERESAREATRLLTDGLVDVALLPTLTILRDLKAYDVLPAVALSTWRYPYARLVLRNALGKPIHRVAFDPQYAQEALVTRIILQEHYRIEPAFLPLPSPLPEELLAADADAALLVGQGVPALHTDRLVLDLGQEWYELSNYPMVWGLFAARKGTATPEMIRALRASAGAAEAQRGLWIRSQEAPPTLHAFYQDDLRVRLDDLAVASLTELRQYLFYYDILDEVAEIPFVAIQDDEGDEAEDDDEMRPRL